MQRMGAFTARSDTEEEPDMQASPLSLTRVFAAATAMVAAGLVFSNTVPSANAGSAAPAIASAAHVSLHDGVDWSRVAAAPVSTGMSVGAYD
jgi:hypothetical protein